MNTLHILKTGSSCKHAVVCQLSISRANKVVLQWHLFQDELRAFGEAEVLDGPMAKFLAKFADVKECLMILGDRKTFWGALNVQVEVQYGLFLKSFLHYFD